MRASSIPGAGRLLFRAARGLDEFDHAVSLKGASCGWLDVLFVPVGRILPLAHRQITPSACNTVALDVAEVCSNDGETVFSHTPVRTVTARVGSGLLATTERDSC